MQFRGGGGGGGNGSGCDTLSFSLNECTNLHRTIFLENRKQAEFSQDISFVDSVFAQMPTSQLCIPLAESFLRQICVCTQTAFRSPPEYISIISMFLIRAHKLIFKIHGFLFSTRRRSAYVNLFQKRIYYNQQVFFGCRYKAFNSNAIRNPIRILFKQLLIHISIK